MDDWLQKYGEALTAELAVGDAGTTTEDDPYPEPDEAGADVASWAAGPSQAGLDAGGGTFDPNVDADVRETLLELARVVAHSGDRRNAPLATFVVGRFVSARVAQGATPLAAAEEALAIAERLTA